MCELINGSVDGVLQHLLSHGLEFTHLTLLQDAVIEQLLDKSLGHFCILLRLRARRLRVIGAQLIPSVVAEDLVEVLKYELCLLHLVFCDPSTVDSLHIRESVHDVTST